ncbi:MAG: hypothetical protein M1820_001051 [Bogoriella megaspora]|nr:MAG: hypothetical protein M1820_001051 [Bogoriella megaspora]
MPSDVHQQLAASAEHDFYALLGVPPDADEATIRKEYRKTSLKYHPDKNPDNADAAEKFHALSDAREILLDATLRSVYDNARKAKELKQRQHDQLDSRRRQMKEELEDREEGFKRKQEEEAIKDTKMRRMAEGGMRRRKEIDAKRLQEAINNAMPAMNNRTSRQHPASGDILRGKAAGVGSKTSVSEALWTNHQESRQRTMERLRAAQNQIDAQLQETAAV